MMRSSGRPALLVLVSLFAAASVHAAEVEERVDAPETRVSLGVTQLSYTSFFRATPAQYALELVAGWSPEWRGLSLELGGGLRAATAREGVSIPLEGFARARFVGRFGIWHPAAGPELGLSGFARLAPRSDALPDDLDALEAARLSPWYFGFSAAPLRFEWKRITVSALEVGLATTLGPPGAAFRLQLGLVNVGYSL